MYLYVYLSIPTSLNTFLSFYRSTHVLHCMGPNLSIHHLFIYIYPYLSIHLRLSCAIYHTHIWCLHQIFSSAGVWKMDKLMEISEPAFIKLCSTHTQLQQGAPLHCPPFPSSPLNTPFNNRYPPTCTATSPPPSFFPSSPAGSPIFFYFN